jgi:TfoX/Sxy family transcriptional regulator of competence genes
LSEKNRLAERIETILKGKHGITQRKMFGGVCFMLHGNMVCGTVKGKLMARVGSEYQEKALKLKHVRPMDFTGKPLKGMIYVLPAGIRTKANLEKWVARALEFARTLPRK